MVASISGAKQFRPFSGLGGLLRCDSGSAFVEFAMLAPLLIAFLFGVLQIGLLYLAQEGLDSAAEDASRLILTGQSQNAAQTAAQFKTAACAKLPPFLSCANLYIDVTTVSSYSSASLHLPTLTYDSAGKVNNSFAFTLGGKGSIQVMRLMYIMPVIDMPFGLTVSNQPKHMRLIMATTVFKNEIYV